MHLRFGSRHFVILIFVFLSLVIVQVTSAQGPAPRAPRTAMGTVITYQGQLKNGGNAYTGTCDFQFSLFNAASSGNQIGITQTVASVTVAGGLFTAPIDFGAGAFNGDARWLGISVRCPAGSGSYTPLTTLQPITAAPYAVYAATANTAITATNFSGSLAGDVTGTQTATTVGKLQGRTVASTAPSAGQVLGWNGTQWQPTWAAGANYQNVVVVAKSGGNFTTVGAALASITTASDTNRFLIKVMPGVYNETFAMKPYVDIEGSGELTTKITYTGEDAGTSGTVVGASNAELRFLTVENTGGGHTNSFAIYNYGASPRLTHITVQSSGATTLNYALYSESNSSPTMTDVNVTGTGGLYAAAVWNASGSSPTMLNVTASASGGTSSNTGVHDYNSTTTMTNVVAKATGGAFATGIDITLGTPTLDNVTATALNAATNYGLNNFGSSPTIMNSNISASGGTTNYGIHNYGTGGTSTLRVNNSKITGSTSTIYNVNSLYVVYVGASQLSGGSVNFGGGSITCGGVFNATYFFSANACF